MKTIRTPLLVSLFLPLTGCGSASAVQVYEVEGATRDFCVPQEYIVSTPSWVPENSPNTPKGFAFSGCDASGEKIADCRLPEEIVTGGVGPKDSFNGWRWENFPADAHYRKIINEPHAQVSFLSGDGVLVVKDSPSNTWMVWKKAENPRGHNNILTIGDELIEVCEHRRSPIVSRDGVSLRGVICTRHLVAGDYALQYSFNSMDEVTKDINNLDARLLASIEAWRCKN